MLLRLLLPLHTISQMSMIPETFIPNRIVVVVVVYYFLYTK